MKQNYDIRINPPKLSSDAIAKHQNFDALLEQFQRSQEPYEVEVNPPKLSSEAIHQHKNFAALLQQFEQTAATETPANTTVAKTTTISRSFLKYGIGALLAIAASVVVVMQLGRTDESGIPYRGEPLALQKPLPAINKSFANFSMDADKGDTLQHQSGSRIIVPASAFVDKKGAPVKGKVEVEYREFSDHVDMFLAGVPKQLDQHQNLQSLGMMEIQGYQDGEPVFIDENKTLQVEMPMEIPGSIATQDVHVYAFNGKTNDWEQKGNDVIEVLPIAVTEINPQPTKQPNRAELDKQIAAIERMHLLPTKPIQPGKHDPKKLPFELDITIEQFPELKNYKGILWEPAPGFEFKKEWEQKEWLNADVRRKHDNIYEVAFSDQTEEVRMDVVPVYINEAQRQKAMEIYNQDLATYEAAKKEQEDKIKLAVAKWEEQNAYAQTTTRDTVANPIAATKKIINRFSIDRFGLWNCGNPQQMNDAPSVRAEFVSADGNPLRIKQVFVSQPEQRLYFFAKTNADGSSDLKYNAGANPTVWAMTEDNQLLVSTELPEEKGSGYAFKLQAVPPAANESDVRRLLSYYN